MRIDKILDKIKGYKWKKSHLIYAIAGLFGAALLFVLFLYLLVLTGIVGNVPSKSEILSIDNPESSNVYASNGKLIGKFFIENRGSLDTSGLTSYYKNALISTEDARFYKHNGVDKRSLARVLFKSILLQKDHSGGGSTIHQQLAKNLFPRHRFKMLSMPINKMREMIIARRLNRAYTKDEILLMYSNTVSFGERAFGLHTAAHRFFNKKPSELNLVESATLVGILKAPTYYSPRNHPERAKTRRNLVLAQMKKYEFLSEEEYQEALEAPLELNYQSLNSTIGLARYFQQLVREEFQMWASANPKEDGAVYDLDRDGLKIYTSLDFELQIAAEQFMKEHMEELQKTFDRSWKDGNVFGPKEAYLIGRLKQTGDYKKLAEQGLTEEEIFEKLNEKANRKIWTWEGYVTKDISVKDSVAHYVGMLHSGVLAADSKSGQIKVWVGGNDYGQFQWDNVQSPRQVGSTFKPVAYLAGLKKGIEPCDYFPNELRTYASFKDWTPRNADGEYGGFMPVQKALTNSVNTVSVQVLFQSGIDQVIQQAVDMGITSDLPKVPSLVLGTADISLYDMVKTYAYLANGGNSIELSTIDSIVDNSGNLVYKNEKIPLENKEIDPIYLKLNTMLSKVVEEGTGQRLYSQFDVPFTVMGKTGTTQNQSDGWFMSYTSDIVIGAWVGAQDRRVHFRNLGTGSGGRTALPLVGAVWEHAASTGYEPSQDITTELEFCLDSISEEEFAMLGEIGDSTRFAQILEYRNPTTITGTIAEKIRELRNRDNDRVQRRKNSSRRSRSSQKRRRDRKIDNFRDKIEDIIKSIEKELD